MKLANFSICILFFTVNSILANPEESGDFFDKYVKTAYSKGVEGVHHLFIENRITMKDINDSSDPYLSYAAEFCSLDLIKYMYEKGATLNPKKSFSPLASALAHHCEQLSWYLIQHGSDLSYEIDGLDMLYFSAQGSTLELFKYLVEKLKPDLNNCKETMKILEGISSNEKHGTGIYNYIKSITPECAKKWAPILNAVSRVD